jgi:acetyl-CoA C-acetyltransferase
MGMSLHNTVYIVDGARTPFLKARSHVGPFSSSDLAVDCGRSLLLRQNFLPNQLDEIVIGSTVMNASEPNVSRVIGLRLGAKDVPAFTVHRNCASGMQALDSAAQLIQLGRRQLILAGGTDDMSRSPLLFSKNMANWLGDYTSAKTLTAKLKVIAQFRLHFLAPIISVLKGLTDPVVGLSMGQTAENLAYRFNITREQMDAFALQSHLRSVNAQKNGYLSEIVPLYDNKGNCYDLDDGVRPDSSMEKLAKLKPFFDKPYGSVTPGNSSQITDGAALLILAGEKAVKQYNLPVLARIVDTQWAALPPEIMGLGPVHAITPLLIRNKMKLNDINYYEINEAFAAQVLACFAAWQDKEYCTQALGLPDVFGAINQDTVNIDGGAIAMGHPIGASGARIVLHLAHILKREKARYGVASLCIGGGQGGAMLIENMNA